MRLWRTAPPASLRARLGWFVALWAGGVAAVGLAGLVIKLVLR